MKRRSIKNDELVKSLKRHISVIPANPGSGPGQAPESSNSKKFWTPAFAGVTLGATFYENIKNRL
jgi:hypothetical protein